MGERFDHIRDLWNSGRRGGAILQAAGDVAAMTPGGALGRSLADVFRNEFGRGGNVPSAAPTPTQGPFQHTTTNPGSVTVPVPPNWGGGSNPYSPSSDPLTQPPPLLANPNDPSSPLYGQAPATLSPRPADNAQMGPPSADGGQGGLSNQAQDSMRNQQMKSMQVAQGKHGKIL